MTAGVIYEVRDGIATLRVDNPPVNALSPQVRLALNELIRKADADDRVRGAIITGTGKTFIAGADIKLINLPRTGPSIGDLLAYIEAMNKPVVAALQGVALGGGFEIAMGCHARIACEGVRVGLPETTLGLIPGAGGTQRLPRLIGAASALDLIVSGKAMKASEALALGAIDRVVETPEQLDAAAREEIDQLIAAPPLPRARDRQPLGSEVDSLAARAAFEAQAQALASDRSPATQAAIAMVARSFAGDFDAALVAETEAFTALRTGPVAQARIHAFLAERAAKHVNGVSADTPAAPIETVAVLGAGTMGAGIAITFASAGYRTQLVDTSPESLASAQQRVARNYADLVARGRMSADAAEQALAQFSWHSDIAEAVANADLVIEAVFEDMDLKKRVFADLSNQAPPHAILASNTSYQDIDELAAQTDRPDRVVGMHYFSPANVMKLLEVVRGAATSAKTLASVLDVARRTGKIPVVVGVCYGFVGNRMLFPRSVQTQRLLLEGSTPRAIDTVLTDFGFRMGPCQMQDMAGIDVSWRLRQARGERLEPADTIADAGRWGQKTGKGWYLYPEGSRTGIDDPDLPPIIAELAAKLGVVQQPSSSQDIHKRLLFPLINEGFRVVEEGIVERPGDIDVIYLHGYGWPRNTGGPMHYAEAYGLRRLADDLDAMADQLGDDTLRPARLLRDLADSGGKLADLDSD